MFKKKKTPSQIATPRKPHLKGIKNILAGSLPATKERRQGEEGGGTSRGLGGAGILNHVLRVDLVLLEDHEDGRIGHAVHAAVVEYIAKALLGWGTDEGGIASDELPHQHPGQEHRVGLGVRFAVVVGVCGIPGKVAPCKDTHGFSWGGQGREAARSLEEGAWGSCQPGDTPASLFSHFSSLFPREGHRESH